MSPRLRLFRIATSVLLLIASAGLLGRAVRDALQAPDVLVAPPAPAFADPAEQARRLRDVVGRFATGTNEGERVIVVTADGKIRFHPLGVLQAETEHRDTFVLGRQKTGIVLSTAHSGTVEVIDLDRLGYFGDEYTRTK